MNDNSEWSAVPLECDFHCHACGSTDVQFRDWESSCGGYEDTRYRCLTCGADWWVEGPDS